MRSTVLVNLAWALASALAPAIAEDVPSYPEHAELSYFITGDGRRQSIRTRDDWEVRRQHILHHVQQVMGPLPRPIHPVPLDVESIELSTHTHYERRKLAYHTDSADRRVRAWLLVPHSAKSPRPAVLCLHQTVTIGKDEPVGLGENLQLRYAEELAERGFVAFAPDYPSFGEYPYEFGGDYASGSMKAIYDNMRAIDLLQSLPVVDGKRIGCIGHSLGGHNSIFTAVFDRRIKAIVSSCGYTSFHKYYGGDLTGWTSPRYMPRIASRHGKDPDKVPFDFNELVAALAPRPFYTVAPLHDSNFAVDGVRDVLRSAKPVYQLYDAESVLVVEYPDCRHEFPPASRRRAYEFLQHVL